MNDMTIENPIRIPELGIVLYGECFLPTEIRHDVENNLAEIPYRRLADTNAHKLVRNWLIWRMEEVDLVQAVLRIHHVVRFSMPNESMNAFRSFARVKYNEYKKRLIILCEPALRLVVDVSNVCINVADIGIEGRVRVHQIAGLFKFQRKKCAGTTQETIEHLSMS